MISLGLDIGSNSVGSAWVDSANQEIAAGVSVFPAGVDETDDKRGAPKNQARREKRALRRNLARRSERKRLTRRILTRVGMFPVEKPQLDALFSLDPWELRRKGLTDALSPHEFGRVLIHLAQRRGAVGFDADLDSEGKVKQAMSRLHTTMMLRYGVDQHQLKAEQLNQLIEALRTKQGKKSEVKVSTESDREADEPKDVRQQYEEACDQLQALCREVMESEAVTFGRFIADLRDERRHILTNEDGSPKTSPQGGISHYNDPVRNSAERFEFHADRTMIRDEFQRLWQRQSQPGGALTHLSELDREQLLLALDNPKRDRKWRHQGTLFGQRITYWNVSTLGRCDLEPTERCVPIADRHASYYRVIETVNNIRIKGPGDHSDRPLSAAERQRVIDKLRSQKTGSVAAVRAALGIDRKSLKKQDVSEQFWRLNLENDEDREINTDWFYREIVIGAISESTWKQWSDEKQEGLNRAILKCDPAEAEDTNRLLKIAARMEIDATASERLISAWKSRPKLEKRLSLSRGAVRNLLPYMNRSFAGRWPTQIEARQMFAEDVGNPADEIRKRRYRIGAQSLTRADRHYMSKHQNELPPAPKLSNPVVRKAIHEVRRHVIAHIRAHGGQKPDRIAIEFAREAKKPKKQADWILALNRKREGIRKKIIEDVVQPAFGNTFHTLSHNRLQEAVDRVILCRQQKGVCAYSGTFTSVQNITETAAALGRDVEIDHIVPRACGGANGWSNKVLCYTNSNRNKGRRTPRKWWGNDFDKLSRPMAFMNGHEPPKGDPQGYFTRSDFAAKWKNFSRDDDPQEWRGSQLTDTAYAARQVQSYLQNALWPGEPSHLEGGTRRIFVTIGSYTHQLRKDWQLFQKLIKQHEAAPEEVQEASAKNRGDHREHAVDAVAIAFTAIPADESLEKDENGHIRTRINDLAKHQQEKAERWLAAKMGGRKLAPDERKPLPTPWGDVKSFRHQVMSMIYGEFEGRSAQSEDDRKSENPIVVSHRPVGRRIVGAFHEDTLFSPVPGMENTYIGRKPVYLLNPEHLRLPVPEKLEDAIKRISSELLRLSMANTIKDAKSQAKKIVESPDYLPRNVDPAPGKSGLVRDLDLRKRIRECISTFDYVELDRDGKVRKQYSLKPDDFTAKEIKQAVEKGAIKLASGVPVKRVKLLRTMTDPVVVHRQRWNEQLQRWVRDTGKDGELAPDQRSRADRAYVGGNNHHIEIREDPKGKWSGRIVTMFEAARRVRKLKLDAVDRSDDPEKGGRFVISLAAGETVCMLDEKTGLGDFFIVFKLEKPQRIQFMHHWDARRAKGEKDDEGNIIPDTERGEIPHSASQFRDFAPPGHTYPFKVRVSPLGEVSPVEGD